MSDVPLRVLLDTSVVRAGFVSDSGASRLLLQLVLRRRVTAVASTALMLEYEEVPIRPETLGKAGVSIFDGLGFVDALCNVCEPVPIRVRWRPQSPDQDDDLIIDAAVNGRVDVIATFNLADLRDPAARFGIVAERPAVTLRRLT